MAAAIAMPLRARATCSKSATSCGGSDLMSAARLSVASFSAASTVVSSSASVFFSASTSFCCAASVCSAFLISAVDRVGFHHPLEHVLLDDAELFLRGLDLVLHRLVFAVGLDGGELILEFREAALIGGGFFFLLAPRLLARFEALLCRVDRFVRVREPRVGVREALRVRGDPPPRLLDRGLEILELDQVFEIGDITEMKKWKSGKVEEVSSKCASRTSKPTCSTFPLFHSSTSMSGPARIRTWDQPIMSRPL